MFALNLQKLSQGVAEILCLQEPGNNKLLVLALTLKTKPVETMWSLKCCWIWSLSLCSLSPHQVLNGNNSRKPKVERRGVTLKTNEVTHYCSNIVNMVAETTVRPIRGAAVSSPRRRRSPGKYEPATLQSRGRGIVMGHNMFSIISVSCQFAEWERGDKG